MPEARPRYHTTADGQNSWCGAAPLVSITPPQLTLSCEPWACCNRNCTAVQRAPGMYVEITLGCHHLQPQYLSMRYPSLTLHAPQHSLPG